MLDNLKKILAENQLIIYQVKEWAEILINWETANKYQLESTNGNKLGLILERGGGFLHTIKRLFLKSHRPLKVDLIDHNSIKLVSLSRDFFFFFSDLLIIGSDNKKYGSIHRKFAILRKVYDLKDSGGVTFATISSPIWRLWTFPIYNRTGNKVGVISKKWQGFLKETFSDADKYFVDFGNKIQWNDEQKMVILASAISVDFDFFENNQGKSGGLLGN